ncbi:MAG: electron transporter RnfB, partial [Erysipelotrichaceae bacterium]
MLTAVVVMVILGALLGLGLGIADKFLKVEIDERVEKVT